MGLPDFAKSANAMGMWPRKRQRNGHRLRQSSSGNRRRIFYVRTVHRALQGVRRRQCISRIRRPVERRAAVRGAARACRGVPDALGGVPECLKTGTAAFGTCAGRASGSAAGTLGDGLPAGARRGALPRHRAAPPAHGSDLSQTPVPARQAIRLAAAVADSIENGRVMPRPPTACQSASGAGGTGRGRPVSSTATNVKLASVTFSRTPCRWRSAQASMATFIEVRPTEEIAQ